MNGRVSLHGTPPLFTSDVLNYRPQTKFAKVMFLQVSVCPQGGRHEWLLAGGVRGCGGCMVAPGGHAWLLRGGGGVRGFFDEIRSMSGHPTGMHSCV